jgi:hypothetical protein
MRLQMSLIDDSGARWEEAAEKEFRRRRAGK